MNASFTGIAEGCSLLYENDGVVECIVCGGEEVDNPTCEQFAHGVEEFFAASSLDWFEFTFVFEGCCYADMAINRSGCIEAFDCERNEWVPFVC